MLGRVLGLNLPQVNKFVSGGRQQHGLVAVEVHVGDGAAVPRQLVQHAPRRGVPHQHVPVRGTCCHLVVGGRESKTNVNTLVGRGRRDQVATKYDF